MAKPYGRHLDFQTWRVLFQIHGCRECPLCCLLVASDRVMDHLLWHRLVIKDEPTMED